MGLFNRHGLRAPGWMAVVVVRLGGYVSGAVESGGERCGGDVGWDHRF